MLETKGHRGWWFTLSVTITSCKLPPTASALVFMAQTVYDRA